MSYSSFFNSIPGASFARGLYTNPIAQTVGKVSTITGAVVGSFFAMQTVLDLALTPGSDGNSLFRNFIETTHQIPTAALVVNAGFIATAGLASRISSHSLKSSVSTMIATGKELAKLQVKLIPQLGVQLAKLGTGLVNKGISVAKGVSDYIIAPNESHLNSNNWVEAAKGIAHAPLALMAGYTSLAAGSLFGLVSPVFIETTLNEKNEDRSLLLPTLSYLSTIVVNEEFINRALVQELILKKGISSFLRIFSSRLADQNLNHSYAKVARVALSSLLFSCMHLANGHPWESMKFQLVNTFGTGLVFGYLQEKTGKVFASIGAHLGSNTLAISRIFR